MKKKIALLLLLMLALTAIFAACSQPPATKIIPRWDTEKDEIYHYAVTLSDFNNDPLSTSRFCSTLNTLDGEYYYKDFVVRAGEPFDSLDEVRPIEVVGTYTLKISYDDKDKYDTVTTRQEINVTYETKDNKIKLGDDLSVELTNELKGLVVESTSKSVTLKSTTETTVEFKHDDKQAPRKSSTKVDGFYIGKAHQEASKYEISTTYNYEGKHAVAVTTLVANGKTEKFEQTLKRYTEGTFIDGNQLFLYARSLDKSSSSFQDSPSVAVYNPMSQEIYSASFVFTASANALLTDASRGEQGEQLFAKLPTLGVVVGGMPFMLQECAPNLKEKLPDLFDEVGNGPDSAFYGADPYAKHTPVRFRVGYLSFELTQYDDALWEALKSPAKSESESEK